MWIGEDPTPGAPATIEALRAAGKRVAFVTNNSREATEEFVARLWRIGIKASLRDVVTVGGAMQHLLADTRTGRTAFVIGTAPMHRHVAEAGLRVLNGTDLASRAEVVVVAGSDEITYDHLRSASLAIQRGADFVATGRDPTYPQPDGLWPGTGAIVVALEYASGGTAEIVGKPEPRLFHTALDRIGEGRTLVVGDRVDTDLGAAARAELDAALVLTGGALAADADGADPKPVAVAGSLAELLMA